MKVMLITGTSSGVGFALGNYFSQKKYKVYGLSRKTPDHALFTTIPTDITKKSEVENAVKHILTKEKKIDVLINNAGKGMVGSIENGTEDEIIQLFHLNVIACVHLFASVLPIMQQQNSGKIINISSIGSEMGLPFRGFYSASKSALDKITEAMRYELCSTNIHVTSLHLGDIKTNIAESRITSINSNFYEKSFYKVFEKINSHVNKGVSAESIAPFIDKLIHQKKLKAHYYFGKFGQKLSVQLKKFLPQTWFEKIIKKYSGI